MKSSSLVLLAAAVLASTALAAEPIAILDHKKPNDLPNTYVPKHDQVRQLEGQRLPTAILAQHAERDYVMPKTYAPHQPEKRRLGAERVPAAILTKREQEKAASPKTYAPRQVEKRRLTAVKVGELPETFVPKHDQQRRLEDERVPTAILQQHEQKKAASPKTYAPNVRGVRD